MELSQNEYALDIRSPPLLLKANLDGLRWHFDNLLNFDASTTAKYRERLLRTNGHHSFYCKDAKIAFDCVIGSNTLVLDGCSVGEGASLHNAAVYTRVAVGDRSTVSDSAIGHRSTIGTDCLVVDSIVGSDCSLADGCKVISSVMQQGSSLKAGDKLEHSILTAEGERLPYKSKAQTNKAILEDNFELEYANDEEQEESVVGRAGLTRL